MAEIEFLLPTVQYGNVKIRATPEELGIDSVGDAAAVGVAYAVYLNAFQQGFRRGAEIDVDIDSTPVNADPQGVTQGPSEAPPGDPGAAAKRLDDGRKPRTVDEANAMAVELIRRELGATVVEESDSGPNTSSAPWNSTVDSKPKPWENGKAAPPAAAKVAEINW